MLPHKQVTDVSLILKDCDAESENLSLLIWLSVSDGQKTETYVRPAKSQMYTRRLIRAFAGHLNIL